MDNTNLITQIKGNIISAIGEDCKQGEEVILEVKNYEGQTYGSLLTLDGRNLVNSKSLGEEDVTLTFSQGFATVYFIQSGKIFNIAPEKSYRPSIWGIMGLSLFETSKVAVEVRGRQSFVWYKDFMDREFRTEPTKALSLVAGTLKVATENSTMVFDL